MSRRSCSRESLGRTGGLDTVPVIFSIEVRHAGLTSRGGHRGDGSRTPSALPCLPLGLLRELLKAVLEQVDVHDVRQENLKIDRGRKWSLSSPSGEGSLVTRSAGTGTLP